MTASGKIALSLLDLAKNSPELEASVRDQLQIARASSPRTVLRAATSVTTALESEGIPCRPGLTSGARATPPFL
jgi:hypothetical protein